MKTCAILKLNMRYSLKLNNKLVILISTLDKNTSKFGIWIGHYYQHNAKIISYDLQLFS